METLRSLMFVPGHRPRMIEKAFALGMEAAVFDLEDSVPPSEMDAARALVAAAVRRAPGRPLRFVRVNANGTGRLGADVRAVVGPGLDGLVLPKVQGPEDVLAVEAFGGPCEADVGLRPGSVRLLATVESAMGLLSAPAIAACSPRLVGLMFGTEDFGLDLGMFAVRGDGGRELGWARSLLVLAVASRHLQAVDGVHVDLQEPDGLRAEARRARRPGSTGKPLIHPS